MPALALLPRQSILPLRCSAKPYSRSSPRLQLRNAVYSTTASSEPSAPQSAHRSFYKAFGRPVSKVFLGALFTYQATYWLWKKLESNEILAEKDREVKLLEEELRRVMDKK